MQEHHKRILGAVAGELSIVFDFVTACSVFVNSLVECMHTSDYNRIPCVHSPNFPFPLCTDEGFPCSSECIEPPKDYICPSTQPSL